MSDRRAYLLEASYRYVLEHGLTDLSLRPLAQAVGSSPRVLLFLFGSKDELIRELLARARRDELELIERVAASRAGSPSTRQRGSGGTGRLVPQTSHRIALRFSWRTRSSEPRRSTDSTTRACSQS